MRSIPFASTVRFAIAICLCATVCPAPEVPSPVPHESYIWQRRWTPTLADALHRSNPAVAGWRVLAAEWRDSGKLERSQPDFAALQAAKRPLVAVFRLEGQLTDYRPVTAALLQVVAQWRNADLKLAGVELDHDCPISQLTPYGEFLHLVRRALGGTPLSITALPAWLGRPELPALLREVDEAVLQVHAVMNPRRGLFAADQALRWIRRWAAISPMPFRVALPNYGSRVSWNEAGLVTSIESEVERYGYDAASRELFASPTEVARLLQDLRRAPPAGLRGFVWFRLPTALDRRAWTLATWHAVMAGKPLPSNITGALRSSGVAGAEDVLVVNQGRIDAELPARIEVAGQGCGLAESLPGYRLERIAGGLRFQLKEPVLLRAGEQRVIGWVRCAGGVYVRP